LRIKKILVASDLSQRSRHALHRAIRLAATHDAELHILNVVDEELPGPVARGIRAAATEALTEIIEELVPEPKPEREIDIRFGDVSKTIVRIAEQRGADLIVLGPHRSRGLAELFRGTTLERVARAARLPVLMVTSPPQDGYRHVVVGVDFSPSSRKAVDAATTLAPEARMTLATAYHIPFKHFIDRAEPGDSDIRAEKRRIERELREGLSSFEENCPARSKGYAHAFIEGGSAESLIGYADERGADLICVGSHGRSWLAGAFLGSTARELFSSAPCDVLVAPG